MGKYANFLKQHCNLGNYSATCILTNHANKHAHLYGKRQQQAHMF